MINFVVLCLAIDMKLWGEAIKKIDKKGSSSHLWRPMGPTDIAKKV